MSESDDTTNSAANESESTSDPCDTIQLYEFLEALRDREDLQEELEENGIVAAGNLYQPGFGDSFPAGAVAPTLNEINDFLAAREKSTYAFGTNSTQVLLMFVGVSGESE
ncbi:MAG: hypothetical protein AAFS02_10415 [Pseudomonadota bacterium]